MTDQTLTDRQLSLLIDIAALEDAGMIQRDEWVVTYDSDGYEQTINLPSTVTDLGRKTVKEAIKSGRTLKL